MPLFLLFGNPKSVKIRAYSTNKGGKNKGISTVVEIAFISYNDQKLLDPATRQGERRLMAQMLLKYGVAFVSGSPPTHEGTMNAANAFSVIQERDNIQRNKKLLYSKT